MPDPGSHSNDVRRTGVLAEDDQGAPDVRADDELRHVYPPGALGERAAGPAGGGGGVPDDGGLHARSSAFSGHTMIPDRYSRDGGDTSPPLEWSDVPAGTAEVAVLCEDPDAPGGTFTHWVVTGIPADVTAIEEGSVPSGAVVGRNDYGDVGWGGPRPPVGDEPHRYFFRVYAVDRPLGLGEGVTGDDLRGAVKGRVLAHGTLVGLFGR
ncbi:YbhB/YbcL family Raf kinase inhibitor-like protein [Saccharothrix hoggarensis]|uniref:YbhB/YbcL family Raf kinase inhibitor-like protein n=1 Tax=Saccharothrix hoggarensis TaxID=913853 RepID=A0ABW3R2X1_9PSEU